MRIILDKVELDDLILAARAARYGMEQMPFKSAFVNYGSNPEGTSPTHKFYVKKNKASLLVRKL